MKILMTAESLLPMLREHFDTRNLERELSLAQESGVETVFVEPKGKFFSVTRRRPRPATPVKPVTPFGQTLQRALRPANLTKQEKEREALRLKFNPDGKETEK